ncbi:MAG: hypothetical protein JST70_14260 [Bacteroidetes bacterium]|nr:hypothetical protein [Bacteroidota bacterium]
MRKAIFISIIVILVAITGYVYWFYYNPYSDGSREGVLQKFSRKGNLFKTYEGEMIQLGFGQRGAAINSQYYYFSVDDVTLADSLEKCLGKIVRLHYIQYRRSLPWRGENYNSINAEKGQYMVDRIEEVRDATY